MLCGVVWVYLTQQRVTEHWFVIWKVHGLWWNLNSLQDEPLVCWPLLVVCDLARTHVSALFFPHTPRK